MVGRALGRRTQKGSELRMAVEYFKPTGGRVLGTIGVLGAVTLGVMVGYDGLERRDWAVLLWPRVGVSETHLHLRNTFDSVTIPLAAIEQLALRSVLAVRVGEKRY